MAGDDPKQSFDLSMHSSPDDSPPPSPRVAAEACESRSGVVASQSALAGLPHANWGCIITGMIDRSAPLLFGVMYF